jgi:membrane AbrB-like protein
MLKAFEAALVALIAGSISGAVFYWLHLPLPWTLGSLFAAALVSFLGGRWLMPHTARVLARPLVGVIAGSAFTPEIVASALHWWDAILAVLVFSVITTLLGNVFFRRVGGFDRTTAFFASSPGGLGEMTLLGGMFGGDMRRLALVHVVRIVLTVVSIPLFFQILLGHPIGRTSPFVPTSLMVFALIFSAAAHASGVTQAVLPSWVSALMQVVIGSIAGARFAGIGWQEIRNTLILAVVWAAAMLLLAAIFALGSSWLLGRPFQAMLLAFAPGGLVEMTVITFALGTEVAFVVTCQVSRILLIVTLMPVGYRWFARPPLSPGSNLEKK